MGIRGTHWGEGPLPLLEVELVEAQSMKDVNLGDETFQKVVATPICFFSFTPMKLGKFLSNWTSTAYFCKWVGGSTTN